MISHFLLGVGLFGNKMASTPARLNFLRKLGNIDSPEEKSDPHVTGWFQSPTWGREWARVLLSMFLWTEGSCLVYPRHPPDRKWRFDQWLDAVLAYRLFGKRNSTQPGDKDPGPKQALIISILRHWRTFGTLANANLKFISTPRLKVMRYSETSFSSDMRRKAFLRDCHNGQDARGVFTQQGNR